MCCNLEIFIKCVVARKLEEEKKNTKYKEKREVEMKIKKKKKRKRFKINNYLYMFFQTYFTLLYDSFRSRTEMKNNFASINDQYRYCVWNLWFLSQQKHSPKFKN